MRIGIDFGTTRVVVAAVDRGNYPVVTFEDPEGTSREWFPPLIALQGGQRSYGWDAWAAQFQPGHTIIRSIKRILEDAGPFTQLELAGGPVLLLDVLVEMVQALRKALFEASSLPVQEGETLEVMLGVPANANSNQRFLTVEAFQRAGFRVLGLLNEPSAASIEYGHRTRETGKVERLLVYDLGGGTFDVSLVRIDDRLHTVVATEGAADLGGDDFDELLAEVVLEAAGIAQEDLTEAELFRLFEECRNKKEALHPNTRRITVDLSQVREEWGQFVVSVQDYYERCRPLVERSISTTERLLAQHSEESSAVDSLYVTGGGSELPVVARILKEVFGRRVRRSAYTRSATAIGLAIQADEQAGYVLREIFHRHFGVWREREAGREIVFDPLFPKGTPLPAAGEQSIGIRRRYKPVHNVGHFRYLECSHITDDNRPTGDITVWDEIRFPFAPWLAAASDLDEIPVEHVDADQMIEESYSVDATGSVEVRIGNQTSGYSRTYRLGRWASKSAPVTPGRRRRVHTHGKGLNEVAADGR
ncbi:MAG: Hsp70 family protein [Bryobacteraceae bacterium]|nr:Hsp70 family protein [Bryobacteraceae bacterium]